jgi:hypothetical protein
MVLQRSLRTLSVAFPKRFRHSAILTALHGTERRLCSLPQRGRGGNLLRSLNYYNWCVKKCSGPYILKWDGDTVATAALARSLERFRGSTKQILWHTGVNLHSDRMSYIAGRPLEWMEPRLFFKRFSFYKNYPAYVESLWSPYTYLYPSFSEREPEPIYFHMKFCKRDRFSKMSRDLHLNEEANSDRGRRCQNT